MCLLNQTCQGSRHIDLIDTTCKLENNVNSHWFTEINNKIKLFSLNNCL